jgi:arylformamidase
MTKSYREVYDITVSLGTESIDYPDTTPYSREETRRIKAGDMCNLSKLVMSAHSGTHVDTPAHFIRDGKNLDEYPVEKWILPAQVVSIADRKAIQPAELENLDIEPGAALLFKTTNSTSGQGISGVFSEDFVYLSPESADLCVEKKVGLVGIDYNTIEGWENESFETHHKILGNGILILEGINLKEVSPGSYTLFCLPLKLKGAEGAPARAILIR